MVTLFMAVEVADLVADSAERAEPLDPQKEAKRLVREHPETELTVVEVAAVLEEEVEAADAEKAQDEQ